MSWLEIILVDQGGKAGGFVNALGVHLASRVIPATLWQIVAAIGVGVSKAYFNR